MVPLEHITEWPRFWWVPGTPRPSVMETVTCCPHSPAPPRGQHPTLGQLEQHIQVVLAAGIWAATGSAGDMGGDGLCSAHISPSAPLLPEQELRKS